MRYKIHINDSNYSEWILYNEQNMTPVNIAIDLNPIDKKLFNCDIMDESYNIVESPTRLDKNIPGILLLVGKTYGRSVKPCSSNGKETGKFYYKCVPNDKRIPAFLIPYEQKNIGFSKKKTNRFILFKYIEWNDKHPIGVVTNTIGDINDLSSFYEYQLYCKNLFISIKDFTKDVNKIVQQETDNPYINNIMQNHPNIENRLDHKIISIDPNCSTDLDDAISIRDNILSVYIANVPILMDYFGLWSSFSERISTIYLPDRKRPMLPTLLSENLCSLLEGESRFAFCMDIEYEEENWTVTNIRFCNALINVKKNYRYDEDCLGHDEIYQKTMNVCQNLCKNHKYVKEIKDSHDLVAFFMIFMNSESANKMIGFKDGIYRTVTTNQKNGAKKASIESDEIPENLSNEIHNFIKIWQSSVGQYTDFNNKTGHDFIGSGLENYIHITSPIRRLVDLLNIMKLQDNLGLVKMSNDASVFYNTWINKLEYINITMRSIRKIQIDCNILDLCVNNPHVLHEIYDGYVFDKIEWENKYLQYTVYIPKIKIVTRINIKDHLNEYSHWKFKLYLIEDGITLKRKIRAELVKEITI